MTEFIQFILPIAVAAIVVPLYDALQRGIGLLNGLPAPVTRIIVGATAFLVSKAAAAGIALTGADVTALTQNDVGNLATAALAYLFKSAQKNG